MVNGDRINEPIPAPRENDNVLTFTDTSGRQTEDAKVKVNGSMRKARRPSEAVICTEQ